MAAVALQPEPGWEVSLARAVLCLQDRVALQLLNL